MSVIHVSSVRQYDKIKNNGLVVVDFSAEWCAPCRRFDPVFERMASENPGVKFLSVDIEKIKHEDCDDVRSVPTFKVFYNGDLRRRFEGIDQERIEKYIERYSVQIHINGELVRRFTPEIIEKVQKYLEIFAYPENNEEQVEVPQDVVVKEVV